MSLPIFCDSSKDDAISYDDWRCEVDTLILRGHSQKKVKLAVLDALESRPKRTAQVADTDHKGRIGKGKLPKILKVLENSYGRSVTYQSLVGKLCSIQQKRGETPKAYYERLTMIILLLRERHGDRIKVKELDSTAKDCFYSGLHEQYQPLVIHLKDKSYTTASDLLKAIRVHEETESKLRDRGYYYRPKYDTSGKPTIDKYAKKSEGYVRRPEMSLRETPAAAVKLQRGCEEEGSARPPIGSYSPSPSGCQGLRPSPNSPTIYWNNDPRGRWLGPENLGFAELDGQHTRVLVDNGARMNTVTLAYVHQRCLDMGPTTELDSVTRGIPIYGVGGTTTGPMGYVVMRVKTEGVPSYAEDQVFLVIDDDSAYSQRVPVILGTPTIN